jgi:23S rRNA (guanosine2251-2'-O)-methyltransferase
MNNSKQECLYGRNAVLEALRSLKKKSADPGRDGGSLEQSGQHGQSLDTLYVSQTAKGLGEHIALAKAAGGVVKTVSPEKIAQLVGDKEARTGGVAATFSEAAYAELDDLFADNADEDKPPFIIVADGIEDPHNLGAIIRTAEAAGVNGLIIPKRRNAGLTAAVAAASAGAAAWLPVHRANNLADTLRELKRRGVWIFGADMDGVPYYKQDFSGAAALVIGSEGRGLSRLTKDLCDVLVSVDMHGQVQSLNASVSAGILMYAIVRGRSAD